MKQMGENKNSELKAVVQYDERSYGILAVVLFLFGSPKPTYI